MPTKVRMLHINIVVVIAKFLYEHILIRLESYLIYSYEIWISIDNYD
jgi:hypothetical protein